MRRSAELQCFEEKSELVASFPFRKAEHLEDRRLNIAAMNSDGAAPNLGPIKNEVVRLGANPLGMRPTQFKIFVHWRVEGMIRRDPRIRAALMPSSPILIHATPAPPSCLTNNATSSSCFRE